MIGRHNKLMKWTGKTDVFLIAEIGGNHEGDFEYAKTLTMLAIESGVDAVKLQVYTGDTLVSKIEDPERNRHFKKFELTQNQYIELAKICIRSGLIFIASVWNDDALNWLDEYISVHKIGSGDLTAYPLIKDIVNRNKPIILSTGLANIDEVLATVQFIKNIDESYISDNKLALLQCTSMYPIPEDDANLNVMKLLHDKTGLTVGYSDHTEGAFAVEMAVAMGAQIIEIHFTDDRAGKTFRDHKVSFTKSEIIELRNKIQRIKMLQGNYKKEPAKSEIESGHITSFRRAVYPKKDIKQGELLSESNLTILRPNHGIDAREFFKLIGKRAKTDLIKHQKLDISEIE